MTDKNKIADKPNNQTAENDGHDHGTEAAAAKVASDGQHKDDPTPRAGEKALDWVRRTIDPGARQLWDVQGPRDGNSRLTGLLVKIKGSRDVLIVQRFEPDLTGETFNVYREAEPLILVGEAK